MVRVGFIVEGETEEFILTSKSFERMLSELDFPYIPEVINARGKGNLLHHNISHHSNALRRSGTEIVIVVTDQDGDPCVAESKSRIGGDVKVICRRMVESWFWLTLVP